MAVPQYRHDSSRASSLSRRHSQPSPGRPPSSPDSVAFLFDERNGQSSWTTSRSAHRVELNLSNESSPIRASCVVPRAGGSPPRVELLAFGTKGRNKKPLWMRVMMAGRRKTLVVCRTSVTSPSVAVGPLDPNTLNELLESRMTRKRSRPVRWVADGKGPMTRNLASRLRSIINQVVRRDKVPVAWPLTMSGQVHRPVLREESGEGSGFAGCAQRKHPRPPLCGTRPR